MNRSAVPAKTETFMNTRVWYLAFIFAWSNKMKISTKKAMKKAAMRNIER